MWLTIKWCLHYQLLDEVSSLIVVSAVSLWMFVYDGVIRCRMWFCYVGRAP